jgi:hypothetical protein
MAPFGRGTVVFDATDNSIGRFEITCAERVGAARNLERGGEANDRLLHLPIMSSSKRAEKPKNSNPRTTSYEFMGPPGALAVTLGVPFMTYALYFSCNERVGACPPSFNSMTTSLSTALTDSEFWKSLYDPFAFAVYTGWYAFCVVAWAVLPGTWVDGTDLRNGKRQKYKINGA